MALAAARAASSGTAAEAMSTRASSDGCVRSLKSGLEARSSSSRPECHHHSPLRCFPTLLGRPTAAQQLIEHEDDRRAAHVAELAQHLTTRRHLVVAEHSLNLVQDRTAAGVDGPEEIIPFDLDAECVEGIDQTALNVASHHPRYLAGDVVFHAAFVDLHGYGILGVRYRGLRGEGHLKQRALNGADRVSADDDGAGAIAEYSLAKDVVQATILRAVEGDERDLGARHEDARAAVVLREFLGELERPAPAVAAVEVEYGAGDRGAEA
ncbi:LOW QUALITY PROTEIN: hypothetical protein U9M48_015294 [Paspalum notatum var. saurae]|uniref:Uncharacterized protein n=1 Tax=Paspalum notatum var. saurae TaxID=547442 RepID=A0AAQ3T437_PASNO